jgi:hypothetical protein
VFRCSITPLRRAVWAMLSVGNAGFRRLRVPVNFVACVSPSLPVLHILSSVYALVGAAARVPPHGASGRGGEC